VVAGLRKFQSLPSREWGGCGIFWLRTASQRLLIRKQSDTMLCFFSHLLDSLCFGLFLGAAFASVPRLASPSLFEWPAHGLFLPSAAYHPKEYDSLLSCLPKYASL
jgi:hypothetical protein